MSSEETVEIVRLQERMAALASKCIQMEADLEAVEKKVNSLDAWRTWLFGIGAGIGFGAGMFSTKIRMFFGAPD